MSTIVVTYPEPQFDYSDSIVMVEVTAAQTFLTHQFIKLTSGKAVATATNDTGVFGFALAPAVDPQTNTLQTRIPVIRCKAGQRYRINIKGATQAQTQLGVQYGIDVTSNIASVDITNTTNKIFEIVELPINTSLEGTIGDTTTRVVAEIIPGGLV